MNEYTNKPEYPPTFEGVISVQERLLSPDGCPWDRQQTPLSLRDMLREECHELLDAIAAGSAAHAAEETGDVLLHILFQTRLSAAAYERVDPARAHIHYPFTQADVFRIAQERLTHCAALYGESGGIHDSASGPAAIHAIPDAYEWQSGHSAAALMERLQPDFASTWALISDMFGAGGGLRCMDASTQAMALLIRRVCYALMESIDPIAAGDERPVAEAAGDALLAVMLVMQQAQARGEFTAADVFGALIAKLVRRHPHVFGDAAVSDAGEVIANWHAIKRAEKPAEASPLDGAPKSLPALAYAQALQTRAARLAFDWDEYADVVSKVAEEIGELHSAATPAARQAEYGDLLFSIVNALRWLDIDAESALSKWNRQRYRNLGDADGAPSIDLDRLSADAAASLAAAVQPGAAGALQFAQTLQAALDTDRFSDLQAWNYMYLTHIHLHAEIFQRTRRAAAAHPADDRLLALLTAVAPDAIPAPKDDFAERHLSLAFDIPRRLSALGAPEDVSDDATQFETSRILYITAQAGLLLGLDSEDALRQASARFYRRFKRMERLCRQRRQDFAALSMDAKEALWQQAKAVDAG